MKMTNAELALAVEDLRESQRQQSTRVAESEQKASGTIEKLQKRLDQIECPHLRKNWVVYVGQPETHFGRVAHPYTIKCKKCGFTLKTEWSLALKAGD